MEANYNSMKTNEKKFPHPQTFPQKYIPYFQNYQAMGFALNLNRRFTDSTNRIVNAPTVRIQEPSKTNGINGGVNAADVSEALTNGKSKKKSIQKV